ncbi:hypothetical protein CYMTET_27002 [Cymbomonas tetramitiformis]|uniref:Uncharacterized protein n=1 Tax=Cymbomonas tetramitiformis TaxID=36881 RepID=A0AAE0KXP1_9CHLO|nr:hypothetical protein CYMTET_27002 [Cymbomonas tetramitiformis]
MWSMTCKRLQIFYSQLHLNVPAEMFHERSPYYSARWVEVHGGRNSLYYGAMRVECGALEVEGECGALGPEGECGALEPEGECGALGPEGECGGAGLFPFALGRSRCYGAWRVELPEGHKTLYYESQFILCIGTTGVSRLS